MRLGRTALALVVLSACATTPRYVDDDALALEAEKLISEHNLPAVGLSVISCEAGSVAVRGVARDDNRQALAEGARFNIGSNSKSMLATVAARLETEGVLSLDDPLSALWPAAAKRAPDKATITLAQLLGHDSGLPTYDSGSALNTVPDFAGSDDIIRRKAALFFLDQPMLSVPGRQTAYSNAGYVVASAVLEEVTGLTLPELLENELFRPLGLEAALGEPRSMGKGQPFGHIERDGEVLVYEDEDPPIPAFLEGAGNVALSTNDYATYLGMHLCALQGRSDFLSEHTARRLHGYGENDGVGLGWGRTDVEGQNVSFHIGGTGDFTAVMIVDDAIDRAVLAVTNIGGAPSGAIIGWSTGAVQQQDESVPAP